MAEQHSADSVFTVKSQKGFKARNALLDAGIELIADFGTNGFSVSELCKKAGLKRTSFYSYFDTIEQYVSELCTREDAGFEADFEELHGQAYNEMTPGLKRMTLTLLQFFSIVNSESIWNRFAVRMFAQHAPTTEMLMEDVKKDISQGIKDGDFQLDIEDINSYAQLILASLNIGNQPEEHANTIDGQRIIEMLLDAGRVKNKKVVEDLLKKPN